MNDNNNNDNDKNIEDLSVLEIEIKSNIKDLFKFQITSHQQVQQILNPNLKSTIKQNKELYLQKITEINNIHMSSAKYKLGQHYFVSLNKTEYENKIKKYYL